LFRYLEQSRISTKNRERLAELAGHEDPKICENAAAPLDLARIDPGLGPRRWGG
jgi:hypothetical protein